MQRNLKTERQANTKPTDFLAEFSVPDSGERYQRKGSWVLLYVKSTLYPLELSKQVIDNINATYIQL